MATTIEFYKIVPLNADENFIPNSFQALVGTNPHFQQEYDREFCHITLLEHNYIGGIFRKVRTDEQIQIGAIGSDGEYIDFEQGQGKFENNPFVYFPEYDIIGYMRNIHANHYRKFENCLRQAFGRQIQVTPLITRATLTALLQHRHVVKLDCAIPVTPNMAFNSDNWGERAIESLASSGAHMVKFDVSVNLRRNDHGMIDNAINSIQSILSLGATKVEVKTETNEGNFEVIDLIADKITHTDNGFNYTRERMTPQQAYNRIIDGYLSKLDEIQQTQRTN